MVLRRKKAKADRFRELVGHKPANEIKNIKK